MLGDEGSSTPHPMATFLRRQVSLWGGPGLEHC